MSPSSPATAGSPKVLVWDLDNTLWDGTLLEGDALCEQAAAAALPGMLLVVRPGAPEREVELLRAWHERGSAPHA
jgi:hypothetical protein